MNDPLLLLGFSTTPLELISFLLSVITVWLNIYQSHWGWLFAIISCATYAAVFFGARLYGDFGLQIVFIVVSVWGWYQWLRGGVGHTVLRVSTLDKRGWLVALIGWGLGYAVLAGFLARYTDTDVPHIDGFLTAGSLLAQLLMSRKKVENWHLWIIVDVLYVGLYAYKQLMLTAALYAIFIVMAYIGLRMWQKSLP
jgi:nicotinamide mononucleotide transporter